MDQQPDRKFPVKLIGLVVGLVVVCFITYMGYLSTKFHVVSTDPRANNVAAVSPFFKINFNRDLNDKGLAISAMPNIVSTYSVSGKMIIIELTTPLDLKKKYTITVSNISDTKGETIARKVFAFTPNNIPGTALSKDQQQAILQKQAIHPPSRNNIGFTGTDSLINYGITLSQVDAFKQAVFLYSKSAKLVSIDPSTIKRAPHDPTSSYDTIGFNVSIDAHSYSASMNYFSLTTIRLYLRDSSSSLVYDSGNITTQANN